MTPDKIFFLAAGLLIALFPFERVGNLIEASTSRPGPWLRCAALAGFVYSISCIAVNGFNPFIYFRF
jgi:alginate O-acetyltransferase complex protein AlgI